MSISSTRLPAILPKSKTIFHVPYGPPFGSVAIKTDCGTNLSSPGLALLIARCENCRNGLEQAQEGVGELDEVKWKVETLNSPSSVKWMEIHMASFLGFLN